MTSTLLWGDGVGKLRCELTRVAVIKTAHYLRNLFVLFRFPSKRCESICRASSYFNADGKLQQECSSSTKQEKVYKCHFWTRSCPVSKCGKHLVKLFNNNRSVSNDFRGHLKTFFLTK